MIGCGGEITFGFWRIIFVIVIKRGEISLIVEFECKLRIVSVTLLPEVPSVGKLD